MITSNLNLVSSNCNNKSQNKNYFQIIVILLFLAVSPTSYSQGIPPPLGADTNIDEHNALITIPEVALLDLEATNGTTVSLNPSAPTEAGLALSFPVTNSSIWLNYSSIIGSTTEPSRNVSVQITSGTVPAGTSLKIAVAADSGNGDGLMGTPSTPIALSNAAQNVITGIGSSYTGNGVNKGHNLQYTLDLLPSAGAYGLLDFDFNETLVITYTLTDY
ncbi:hypothetical protein [Flavobacterium sp.]|jgi:hypothetical protein|uniref:hypothetical protein n=1 Tax=Flavobacterium sp. TaxID=239 RepID=UPI0037BEBE36